MMQLLYLAAAPSSEVSTLIIEILEEWYFDGIETLVSAELQGKKIVGEFTDQVNLRSIKRFKYEISEQSVEYWLLNGQEAQGFSAQMFRRPLFGKGSRAGQKKKCTKGVPCGNSCQSAAPNSDGSPRRCSKQPGSATQAKIKQAKQALGGKGSTSPPKSGSTDVATQMSQGFKGEKELFAIDGGATIAIATPRASARYNDFAQRDRSFVDLEMAYISQAMGGDGGRTLNLPSRTDIKKLKDDEVVKLYSGVIKEAGYDGESVMMNIKTEQDRAIAEKLGLAPAKYRADFNNQENDNAYRLQAIAKPKKQVGEEEVWVGKKEGDRVVPYTEEDIRARYKISMARVNQIDALKQHNEWRVDEDLDEPTNAQKNAFFKREDKRLAEIEALEDAYFGRTPTTVGDFAAYEKKSAEWAKAQFGEVAEGANGFSLEQTKAHDVAHPITHELIGLTTPEIHTTFGGLKGADGKPSLIAEEAIVNVVEHLSRGDGIDGSILNGVRLARVLSRNEPKEIQDYVRSREFKNKLMALGHRAYRHNNFSPLIKHVRKSNQVAGTVHTGGFDFANSASGG